MTVIEVRVIKEGVETGQITTPVSSVRRKDHGKKKTK